jgi:hypothetical protein
MGEENRNAMASSLNAGTQTALEAIPDEQPEVCLEDLQAAWQ